MNIIEVARNRDEIMAGQCVMCPICVEKQFSPFDKLYTKLTDKCVDCSDEFEVEKNSAIVFNLIEHGGCIDNER